MSLLTESENPKTKNKRIETAAKDDDVVVRLENVSVVYSAPRERIKTFKEYAIRKVKRQIEHQQFNALRDVCLELRRGEVFGLIGHNGAGKSTMLKLVSRVMKPTSGRVWVKGKIAPLLELGAGFHPELSGRENIFLNGTLLGNSRAEMAKLFDGIVEFAEIGDFIDAPLRTYSTGMAGRLGFAVATATRPDILIVDEVLSVGDEQFQEKCAERITEFRQQGTTILLVTHSSTLVERICDRAAWLDHGQLCGVGLPTYIIHQYHDRYHLASPVDEPESIEASEQVPPEPEVSPEVQPKVIVTEQLEEAEPLSEEIAVSDEVRALEERALQKAWFYPFALPSGRKVECHLPPHVRGIHANRLAMVESAMKTTFGEDWSQLDCLDVGSNQGFFSVKLAQRGCRKVVGLEARQQNVEDAELIREMYDLTNLSFQVGDVTKLNPAEWPQFDVTLMLSVLFWLENPIGVLRTLKSLTRRILIIETLVSPEFKEEIIWDSRVRKQVQGSFSVLDLTAESQSLLGSLTELSFCPGRESLIWILEKLGFSSVELVVPPPNAYEQLASGVRIMIVARV
jgi:ABC-2 type transport system ATP-binding protein/lipopolysaccharide transport system ATP-binding protein